MPFRGTPVCLKCETNESPMWTNAENLGALCLNCVNETKQNIKQELEEEEDETKQTKRKPRSTRSYKTRLNPFALPKLAAPKGRGRRGIFKKTPVKAPSAVATPVTSDFVFHKGTYFQIGDIVSMSDESGDIYYAQITGLLTDQYCEKSAVITWLLPTRESPPPNQGFDPASYVIGLEEDIPRSLDCMEFIMHAPSDYYQAKTTPYPTIHAPAQPGFIWTSLETMQRICSIAEADEDEEDEEKELLGNDSSDIDKNDSACKVVDGDDNSHDDGNRDGEDDDDDVCKETLTEDEKDNNPDVIHNESEEIEEHIERTEEIDKDTITINENIEDPLENIPEVEEVVIESCTEEKTEVLPMEVKEEEIQMEQVIETEENMTVQEVSEEEKPTVIDLSPFLMTED